MPFLRPTPLRAIPILALLSLAVVAQAGAAPPWPGVSTPSIVTSQQEGAQRPSATLTAVTGVKAASTMSAAGGPALGDVRWLALMADFADRPGISGAAAFTQLVQGNDWSALNGYYAEVSYGQLNLLGSLNTTDGWPWSQSGCCAGGALMGPVSGPPGVGSLPNLRLYQPTGWSGAIVVSSQPGTNGDDLPLLSNQVLYVDWAVVNDSAAPAGSFRVALKVDGVEIRSWSLNFGLAAGAYAYVEDQQLCALGPGAHVVTVCVDVDSRVAEGNEDDNCGGNAFPIDPIGASPEWYRLPETHAYYANHSYGLGAWPQNHQKLVADAVVVADPYVDYSQFDNDGDGQVDYLAVIHAGTGAEVTGSPEDLWSWQGELSYNGGEPVVLDGVTIDRYVLIPERMFAPCDVPRLLGVLAHEFGHLLGLPDLYDTDETSYGIGRWCLMGYGCQANWGQSPLHLCAWAKAELGWLDPIDVTTSILGAAIPCSSSSPTAYRLRNHTLASGEYFLVENRQRLGYDLHIPGDGLLICHVDQNQADNDSEWYCPDHVGYGNALVAVEQADGLWDLERKQNQGDWMDPWPGAGGYRSFNGASIPNSLSYFALAPCEPASSSISVTNISDSALTMTADLVANLAPVCAISAPTTTCLATAVAFASDSWDPDGELVSWAWDFGDGESGSGEFVTHSYQSTGSYVVTLVVTDNDGTASACTTSVTVADEPPTIQCPADLSVVTSPGECQAVGLDVGTAVCSDDCGACSVAAVRSDGVALTDPYPVGTTVITWTATDPAGLTATCQQTITVADVEPPVIVTCASDTTAVAGASQTTKFPKLWNQIRATDNCDITLTITQSPEEKTEVSEGVYPVTFTVTDQSGNYSTCTCTVTVIGRGRR